MRRIRGKPGQFKGGTVSHLAILREESCITIWLRQSVVLPYFRV